MKNNFKWHKEQINGKWYSVCDHKHVPMIEHTKDGKYKLRNANGKAVLHEEYKDAVKLALEVYEKFKKFNKEFEEQFWRAEIPINVYKMIVKQVNFEIKTNRNHKSSY